MSFWKWLRKLWPWYEVPLREQSDAELVDTYCEAGLAYAEVYLDLDFDTADDFDELLQKWIDAEDEMQRRNFVVFPLESFARAYIGRQNDIQGLGEYIPPDVSPLAYARDHREKFIKTSLGRARRSELRLKTPCFWRIFVP